MTELIELIKCFAKILTEIENNANGLSNNAIQYIKCAVIATFNIEYDNIQNQAESYEEIKSHLEVANK